MINSCKFLVYLFTTCGAIGPEGPTQEKCDKAYNNSPTSVEVLKTDGMKGYQKWIVPESTYYT